MSDASDASGLFADAGEQVPRGLRVLAAAQNLGALRSTHRPTSRLARFAARQGRIYVFDQGFVIGVPGGGFALLRNGEYTVRKVGRGYLIRASDGRQVAVNRKWSDYAALEQAVNAGAATAA